MLLKMRTANPNRRFDSGASSATAYRAGPRMGRSSQPGIADMRNPTLTSTQISMQTNVTTSLPLMCRPWRDGWEKYYKEGTILFAFQGEGHVRLTVAADIPALNYICDKANTRMMGDKQAVQESPHYPEDNKPTSFKWEYFGCVRNDMLSESSLQKLMNCDVWGRTMMANIFGKVKRNDLVGLALCTVDVNKLYASHMMPNGNIAPAAVTGSECLMILPTVNNLLGCGFTTKDTDREGPDGLHRYMKNDFSRGVLEIHKMWPLGAVQHNVARCPTDHKILQSLRSQNEYILLPRIEVMLH